jgi:hypothetical protein
MPEVSELKTDRKPTDPFVEPLSCVATELTRIAAEIQAVECSHLERMESAAAQLRKQLESEFQTELDAVRAEFELQLCKAAEWETERQKLLTERQTLLTERQTLLDLAQELRQRGGRGDVAAEVAKTEAALAGLQREIQALLEDSNADLSLIMRKNSERMELEAYLKGLAFK